ncbi:MAG: hypothetical protein K6F64_00530 [Clostridia bacterium]|nr:hypothetical protein [Clostridia bacterium]
MIILGIDIGTTGIGAALLDTDNCRITKTVTRQNKATLPGKYPFEKIQSSEIIYECVCSIIEDLGKDVSVIGFTGQMHGIVYTDKTGNAISPLYTWQDSRGGKEFKDGKTYASYLGCFPGYGLSTAFYNRNNNLEPENAAYICTIADYVAMKLCGNKSPLIHITNAASLGCFDIGTNRFTADEPMLPPVTADFELIGKTAGGIPVCVAIGDNQASFIGSVPYYDGALLNVGTGAQISFAAKETVRSDGVEMRPLDGSLLLAAGCSLCGGRAFAIFEKFCRNIVRAATGKDESFYPVLDRIDYPTLTDIPTVDTRFCGTRGKACITGGISGLTESNFNFENLAFGMLDGIIGELKSMYPYNDTARLICSGNGFGKNPILFKLAAKHFGAEPFAAVYDEEAAAGACFSAGLACGEYKNSADFAPAIGISACGK